MGDIIVIGLLLVCIVLAVISIWKGRKKGGCCGNCSHCSKCQHDS